MQYSECFSGAAVCTVGWVSLSGGRGEGRWKAAAHCSQLPQLHSAQADWLHKRQYKWVGEPGCTLQTDRHRTQTALPSPHSGIVNLRDEEACLTGPTAQSESKLLFPTLKDIPASIFVCLKEIDILSIVRLGRQQTVVALLSSTSEMLYLMFQN